MSVDATTLLQLSQRSLRLHALLIAVIILATVQAGLVLSITLQMLHQEQDRIQFHFRRLTGAIEQQERFMERWRAQDRKLLPLLAPMAATPRMIPELGAG